jgi:hypothetical protein
VADGSATTPAAESNTSAQTIWQVQVGGCISHCEGATQLQTAQQQDAALQAVGVTGTSPSQAGTSPSSPPGEPASGPADLSQLASTITQTQVGCQLYCFGASTTSSPLSEPALAALLSALQQLLSSPAPLPQLLSDLGPLRQLLSAVAPSQLFPAGLATVQVTAPDTAPSIDQNSVDQTAYQVQTGGPGTVGQTQSAIQVNTTVQSVSVMDGGQSAASDGRAGGVVNQAVQSISQLQIGCIFYCVGTQQTQQATQSNTLLAASGSDAGSSAAVTNAAAMRIWQLQIGCLFWCEDAVALQLATVHAGATPVDVVSPAVPSTGTVSPPSGSDPATPGAGTPAGGEAAPVSATAAPSPTLSPEPAPAPAGQLGISGPPASPPGVSSGSLPFPVPVGRQPSPVRVSAAEPVQSQVGGSRPLPGTVALLVLSGRRAPIAKQDVTSRSPGGRNTTTRAGRAGERSIRARVTPRQVNVATLSPATSITPSLLLVAFGGVLILFLVGLLISARRGMSVAVHSPVRVSRPLPGAVAFPVLPSRRAPIAKGSAPSGSPGGRDTTVRDDRAGERPVRSAVVSRDVKAATPSAGRSIAPTPLLMAFGGVVILFLVRLLISARRGMSTRI